MSKIAHFSAMSIFYKQIQKNTRAFNSGLNQTKNKPYLEVIGNVYENPELLN